MLLCSSAFRERFSADILNTRGERESDTKTTAAVIYCPTCGSDYSLCTKVWPAPRITAILVMLSDTF